MGKCDQMKKEIYLPVIAIAIGELMMFFNQVYTGLAIHIITLQSIVLFLIFSSAKKDIKNVQQALLLVLQMRIINLAMPQFFTITLLWYPLIYGVMFIPIYFIIRHQQMQPRELGMNLDNLFLYLPTGILIGIAASLVEYIILDPTPLIKNLQISNLVLIGMIMFFFVGAAEELIFRSILQTRLENVLGTKYGLLISSAIFGVMHAGTGLISEILFAASFGMVLGYFFQKTRSFPFILTVHGTANVMLFGILPIIITGVS